MNESYQHIKKPIKLSNKIAKHRYRMQGLWIIDGAGGVEFSYSLNSKIHFTFIYSISDL